MLLEYTEETKDADLGERALAIRRRVAQRKLQRAIDEGSLGSETLLRLKQQNKGLLNTFKSDNVQVTESAIAARVAIHRSDQHLRIVDAFRQADRDLSRIQVLGKAKLDTLSDLEKRIHVMRKRLMSGEATSVEDDMQKEVSFNGRASIERMYSTCPRCHLKILSHMATTHEGACQRVDNKTPLADSLAIVLHEEAKDLTTFLPQPPRNFRLIGRGCTFLHWAWEPPVMEGGLPVIDYEMRYKCRVFEVDEMSGRTKTYTVTKDAFKTSLWCLKRPIAHEGYNITGLLAGCEYFEFQIRSQNRKGFSDWVPMTDKGLDIIRTDDPDPPTSPLRFQVSRITSSCIYLRWDPPFFDGGRAIAGYVVSYVVLEREVTSHMTDIVHEVPNAFKVNRGSTT